jgi:hypothetical protein
MFCALQVCKLVILLRSSAELVKLFNGSEESGTLKTTALEAPLFSNTKKHCHLCKNNWKLRIKNSPAFFLGRDAASQVIFARRFEKAWWSYLERPKSPMQKILHFWPLRKRAHHTVSKRRTPITQWRGVISLKNVYLNSIRCGSLHSAYINL